MVGTLLPMICSLSLSDMWLGTTGQSSGLPVGPLRGPGAFGIRLKFRNLEVV